MRKRTNTGTHLCPVRAGDLNKQKKAKLNSPRTRELVWKSGEIFGRRGPARLYGGWRNVMLREESHWSAGVYSSCVRCRSECNIWQKLCATRCEQTPGQVCNICSADCSRDVVSPWGRHRGKGVVFCARHAHRACPGFLEAAAPRIPYHLTLAVTTHRSNATPDVCRCLPEV